MKKLVALLIVLAFLSLLGFRLYQEWSEAPRLLPQARGGAALLVETAKVQPSLFESDLEILGELRPKAEVRVMPEANGRLESVLVDRGQEIRRGELLATIEDDEILRQIQRSEAALRVARARVKREEATRENQRLQVRRNLELYQAGLISPQDLEDLESLLRVAEADVELVKAQVQEEEAALSQLRLQQEKTRVYSPLDGVVGIRHLDPGAQVNSSVVILTLLQLDRIKTVVPVTASVIQRIRVGLPAEIALEVDPDRKYQGQVTRISPFLSPDTRSADVEIETANPGGALKPGMLARVRIDINVARRVRSIPRSGLIMKGEQQGVFLLTRQLTVEFRPVRVGAIQGDVVEVLGGVDEGTEIVTTGAQNLNDGDQVRTQ